MIRSIAPADRAGIVGAVACAVHCLVVPIVAASMPMAGILISDRSEYITLAASLLLSSAAMAPSCTRRDASVAASCTFCLGAGLLLSARLGLVTPLELPLTIVGAGFVVAAHVINLAKCLPKARSVMCDRRIVAAIGALLVGLAAIVIAS